MYNLNLSTHGLGIMCITYQKMERKLLSYMGIIRAICKELTSLPKG